MAEDDAVFKALADPTRRALLDSCSRRNRAAATSIIASLPSVAQTSKPRRGGAVKGRARCGAARG